MPPYVGATYAPFALNRIQFGREADAYPGTDVAATHVHRGPFVDIEDTSITAFVDEQTGVLADTGERYVSAYSATLNLPAFPFSFGDGPIHFEAGVIEGTTASTTAPYVRTYAWPVTAAAVATWDVATYTWETHNVSALDSREMNYSFVQSFTLEGARNEPWLITPVWIGDQVTAEAFTTSLSVASLEYSMFQNSVFYLDASGGSGPGTTQVTGVLVGATINVSDTGIRRVWTPNGALTFAGLKIVKPTITGTLIYELEGTGSGFVVTERAAYTAGTSRSIRIKTTGSASQYWQFDAAIKYTSFGTYENDDGDTVVSCEWEARYDPTDAIFAQFEVANLAASYT